jgi:hypothetical protein
MVDLQEQMLETQKGADPFVERMFVKDKVGHDVRV